MCVVRLIGAAVVAALALGFAGHDAQAQTWPNKPVTVIVPFASGGNTDGIARMISQRLSDAFGQPFVVENKGGASGIVGTEAVARAPADGYTLLMTGNGPHAVNPGLFNRLTYDPVKDFAPVSLTAVLPLVLNVHPSVPARDLARFIAWAKAEPGRHGYASPGIGTPPHLTMELLKSRVGVDLVHVPYKGSAPALADLVAGQVPVMFDNVLASYQHIRSGRIAALAVGTRERLAQLPDVPTFVESGLAGFEAYTWTALVAPAGTPGAVIERLASETAKALADPAMAERLAAQGAIPRSSTPAELAAFTGQEIAKWSGVIRAAGVTRIDL